MHEACWNEGGTATSPPPGGLELRPCCWRHTTWHGVGDQTYGREWDHFWPPSFTVARRSLARVRWPPPPPPGPVAVLSVNNADLFLRSMNPKRCMSGYAAPS